jgi:carbon-monoxide dehydrogenase iron sulfur subunit
VVHHEESCVGCGSCILVCPYDALKFDEKNGRVVKCNLCMDEETPPCVMACQSHALIYEDPARFARERKKAFALEMRRNRGAE